MAKRMVVAYGLALLLLSLSSAAELPIVEKVELQPLAQQAKRVSESLDYLGSPLSDAEKKALSEAKSVQAVQAILDKHCLLGVLLKNDKTPSLVTSVGTAKPELAQQGWRVFLVKVSNPQGVKNVELKPLSPNALPMVVRSTGKPEPPTVVNLEQARARFLDVLAFNEQPLVKHLDGLEVEYRIVQIYCREAGSKEASLGFTLTKDDGKTSLTTSELVSIRFESQPAIPVTLKVKDFDGKPTMGNFTFRDSYQRVYPSPTRRLAPDFFFHAQVYRADGETVLLQPGKYTVTYTRGPEYLVEKRALTVQPGSGQTESFELKRWTHPAKRGWWSGDHHIHAAGCAHYENPTEGVGPADMMRHILGEDLNVGCCLSWGPCWYHQKTHFEGKTHKLSTPTHLLRYDVEVSGFPSSHAGHICLLRLREQDYPNTKRIEDWPSWDLPIFAWAKKQGGVVGFAHSGHGLDVGPTRELPNFIIPPMNGIGANEYIMDITHNMCDFISTVDTQAVWELNIWYHTLNCGYRCRISGETDFPCIYGERVGMGRSYVHLDKPLNFEDWAEGIKQGRSYVSDGKSHLLDFKVHTTEVGRNKSEVHLAKPGKVQVQAKVSALLEANPTADTERIRKTPLNQKPYWDLERSRLEQTRKVPVELVVNGYPVAKKEIEADGKEHEVQFEVSIEQSSWVALRIFPSSHTNPVFVLVDNKPIRASKRSAEWCIKTVERCWENKKPKTRDKELLDAQQAYDSAKKAYEKILSECVKE